MSREHRNGIDIFHDLFENPGPGAHVGMGKGETTIEVEKMFSCGRIYSGALKPGERNLIVWKP